MALVLSQTGKVKNNHLPDGTICPTIERGNGIHYKIPYIDTSWRRWGFPLLDNYYFYEQGVGSKITWFDYSGNCNELTPASNYYPLGNFNNHYSLLFSGNATSEDYESTTWKTLYNELLENISWLWGNVEEGGTFIYKCSSNPSSTDGLGYVLCMWWGIYTKTETVNNVETTYYKIAISHYSGSQRTLNQLKQVGWCVYNNTYYRDGEDVENNYDYLSAFLSGNNSTWKAGNNDIGITATDNQTATSRNDYYTVFGIGDDVDIDVPVLIWTPTNTTDNVLISLQDWRPEAPWVQISGVPEDGYDLNPTGGIDVTGGGYGTPDEEGDDIDDESLGDLNSLTAINTGLVTLFRPTQTELQNFSSFLYTGITDSIADQLKKLIANPLDYLVFVALCKFAPPVSGVREEISFAGVGSGVYADKISNQFYDLDCGSIQFGEQYNSFLTPTYLVIQN